MYLLGRVAVTSSSLLLSYCLMVDVGQSPDPPSGQQPKSLSTRTSTSRCTLDKNHLYSSSTSTASPSSALAPGGATPIIDDDNGRLSAAPITATAHSTRAGHLDAASHESTPLIRMFAPV